MADVGEPLAASASTASGLSDGQSSEKAVRATGVPRTAPKRSRSTVTRVLVALTSSASLLTVAAIVAAAAMVPPVGARRAAREAADREVRAQLAVDESVVAKTYASQRRWTDFWRESFGIVIATNRRVLYVGAPPTPLLRPREDGPSELLVESYPYDASFTLEPHDVFFGMGRGLALRTPAAKVEFLIGSGEWNGALAVAKAALVARRAVHDELDRPSDETRVVLPPPPVYVPYVVKRGETLTSLGRRFHTTPDVLRQLNKLTSDDIRAGQRLRVPQVTPKDTLSDTLSP